LSPKIRSIIIAKEEISGMEEIAEFEARHFDLLVVAY
jgi:hypothetical protein